MQVKEVMTRNAECTKPEATLRQAAQRMKELDVGGLPVCGNDRLLGMITDRDITIRAVADGENPDDCHVSDAMTSGVIYCFDDQDVSEAASLMEKQQIRRIPVMNHDKRLVGIISLGDLAVHAHDGQMARNALESISEPAAPCR